MTRGDTNARIPTAEEVVAGLDVEALGKMSFAEIEARHGEEVAICVGALTDPDVPELGEADFARMRRTAEIAPHRLKAARRNQRS